MMQDETRSAFAHELDCWVRRHFHIGDQIEGVKNLNRVGTLECRYDSAIELYLRLWLPAIEPAIQGYWPARTLVIARIEFAETRTGNGKAFLNFLASHAHRYGYEKIAIEQTHTGDDIKGFAKNFGFKHAWPDDKRPDANWIAPVASISDRLR